MDETFASVFERALKCLSGLIHSQKASSTVNGHSQCISFQVLSMNVCGDGVGAVCTDSVGAVSYCVVPMEVTSFSFLNGSFIPRRRATRPHMLWLHWSTHAIVHFGHYTCRHVARRRKYKRAPGQDLYFSRLVKVDSIDCLLCIVDIFDFIQFPQKNKTLQIKWGTSR